MKNKKKKRYDSRRVPEGLGEDEEGREAEGIGRVGEKETGAVGEIGGKVGGRFR